MRKVSFCGWAGHPQVAGYARTSEDLAAITEGAVLTRGLGRSYGDAALPPAGAHVVAVSSRADRILRLDLEADVLRAEAGVSLRALDSVLLPRGRAFPVSPGTEDVTLGGMVAADVHGKNHHHDGSLGGHVRALRLRVADGRVLDVSRVSEPELFRATLGGMGLTGHILEAEIALMRIPTPWMVAAAERLPDVRTLLARLPQEASRWRYTAGWVDALAGGRALLFRARWAETREAPRAAPRPRPPRRLPRFLRIGRRSVRLFNAFAWRRASGEERLSSPYDVLYPLDRVRGWNRLYGRRGFVQYQCLLSNARAVEDFFARLRDLRASPFLSVVKDCGPAGEGMLSFPGPGFSVAVDLPLGPATQGVVDGLAEFVVAAGGRIYLAKDALTRASHFRAMEPRLEAWERVRAHWDPERRLRSALGARLLEGKP